MRSGRWAGAEMCGRSVSLAAWAGTPVLVVTLLLGLVCATGPAEARPAGRRIDATGLLAREIPLPTARLGASIARPGLPLFSRTGSAGASTVPGARNDPQPDVMPRAVLAVGAVESFWLRNFVTGKFERIQARLAAQGRHCHVFVQEGQTVSAAAAERVRKQFDEVIHPTCIGHFGAEPRPGIDGDARVFLLLADIQDGYVNPSDAYVAGFFFAGDLLPQSEFTPPSSVKSNEREILYVDTSPSEPEAADYLEIVAHEFQHMIHANNDDKEVTWVNEGCSQVSPVLCGFAPPNHYKLLVPKGDRSLNGWQSYDPLPDYGQSYLWNQFLLDHLLPPGPARQAFFRTLVGSKKRSIGGFRDALATSQETFTAMFTRFALANTVNDLAVAGGKYAYRSAHLRNFRVAPTKRIEAFPAKIADSVHVWGADSFHADLSRVAGRLAVSFSGYARSMSSTRPSFRVALVRRSSKGLTAPVLDFIDLKVNPQDQNRLIGTGELAVDGRHDDLIVVVMALAPEDIDDTGYMPVSPFIYDLAFQFVGTPTVVARAEPAGFDLEAYAEFCRSTAGDTQERHIDTDEHFRALLRRAVTQELEQGRTETLDGFLDCAAALPGSRTAARDLLARLVGAPVFPIEGTDATDNLAPRLARLRALAAEGR